MQPKRIGYEMLAENLNERANRRSRTGVKAVVFDCGHLLLIKERRNDGSTFWTLPGGGVQPGESLREGLRRELNEEIQTEAKVGALVATCIYEHTTPDMEITFYRIFTCDLTDTVTPNCDEGIIEYTWVKPTNLPSTTLAPFRHALQNLRLSKLGSSGPSLLGSASKPVS